MDQWVILQQIAILALLTGTGYVTQKLRFYPEGFSEGLRELIVKITLPLMIFSSITDLDLSLDVLKSSFLVVIFSYISMFILLSTGTVSAKILKLKKDQYNIHRIHTAFGNIAFLGYPLLDSLFPGGKGLFFALIYHVVTSSLIWTVGVMIFNKGKDVDILKNLKHLINPNTVAFFFGILFFLLNIKIPYIIKTSAAGLGSTTIYLSMIYIGMLLERISIKGTLAEKQIYFIIFNKMLLVPLLMIMLIDGSELLFSFQMDSTARSVVVLQTAMPCMAMIIILASKFRSDEHLAAKNVFLTTIFSILTLPFVYWMLNNL